MTRTCHLGVVGDSHATNVVVGCRRHLSGTPGAVAGDRRRGRGIFLRWGFAYIYMNLHKGYSASYV